MRKKGQKKSGLNRLKPTISQKRNSRGLSTIVITLIIILISLVAVGIIWVVVRNVIQSGTEGIALGQFTLGADIINVNVNNSSNNVSLSVKRSSGEGEITGIKFIFSDDTDSEIITEKISMNKLEEKRFTFHLTKLTVSKLISISIVPVLSSSSGKETLGSVLSKYNVQEGTSTSGTTGNQTSCVPDCTGKVCGNDGCGGSCGTCSTGTCNSTGSCVVSCAPATCVSLGRTCGTWSNGTCSGTSLFCGNCNSTSTCNSTGSCVPNPPSGGPFCGPSRTYYIDYENGVDSNNGTCSNSAWKRHPYMVGFVGSYSHQAGDKFIFKGGVTWPNLVFRMNIINGGTSESIRDYYGVDARWYKGGTWTRPIFDLQGQLIGTNNVIIFMDNYGASYVTFDNIEFTNYYWNNETCPWTQNTFFWNGYGNVGINVFNCYFHGWTHAPSAGDCAIIMGGNGRYQDVAHNHMDGTASGGNSGNSGSGYNYYNNTVHDMANGPVGTAVSVHDNLIYNIRDSFAGGAYHTNGIEVWLPTTGETTQYIYNNVLHDLSSGTYPLPIGPGFGRTGNVTAYVFNNVMWNINWGMPFVVDCSCAVGIVCTPEQVSVYIWSNTISTLPLDTWGACIRLVNRGNGNLGRLDLRDNHCITNSGKLYAFDTGVSANTLINTNNILMSTTDATNFGYTISNLFAPTSTSSVTVNTGVNLSSVFNKDRNGISRPQGSAWDIGAYEYV